MYRLLRQIAKTGIITEPAPQPDESLRELEQRLGEASLKRFGRSLAIRHVDAGSCNGCEHELTMVSGPHYDLQRFGFGIVASPIEKSLLTGVGASSGRPLWYTSTLVSVTSTV